MTRRALVTGATGFLGRHLVARLVAEGWCVAAVVREGGGGGGGAAPSGAQVTIALGPAPWDARRFGAALAEFAPEVVFHLAGRTAAASAPELYAANTVLAAALFEAVERSVGQPPAVVLAGSAAEYGPVPPDRLPVAEDQPCRPVTDYGISKYAQTLMGLGRARAAGLRVLVARIFNTVGRFMPRHLALANFAAQIGEAAAAGEHVLRTGDLDVARDFLDVAEAARLIAALAATPEHYGAVYNICSGRPFVLRPLVEDMLRLSGRRLSLVVDPARLRPGEARVFYGDTTRLAALGLAPNPPDFGVLLPALLSSGGAAEDAA